MVYPQIVIGGWGNWLSWSTCSRSCGTGTQIRKRFCDNPAPINNGTECVGISFQSNSCSIAHCPGEQKLLI